MSDVADCRAMEMMYRQRAEVDPANRGRWLGQAERWHDLGKREAAWRFQKRDRQQQMHAGPMQVGPNTVNGDARQKQQG